MSLVDHQHPLVGLRLTAAIDWIEVEVTLAEPSQPQHVRARMPEQWGKPFVDPVGGHPSRTDRVFRFRVQDPGAPSVFMRDIQALSQQSPISEDSVRIVGLEVALDAYHPEGGAARASLARAVSYFQRHHARPPEGMPRITEPGHFRAAARPHDTFKALMAGLTVNAGAQRAAYRSRYYLKDSDTIPGSESHAPLPLRLHRARIEVTLTGTDAPFITVDAWRQFRYETLAERFAMCLSVAATPTAVLLTDQLAQLGKPAPPVRQAAQRRKSRPKTQRDTQANERIRQALRGLTERRTSAEIRGGKQVRSGASRGKTPTEAEKS